MTAVPTDRALAERLIGRTLELVSIASPSRGEAAALAAIRAAVPQGYAVADDADDALLLLPDHAPDGAPLVVLAGHADTVPQGGASAPGRVGDAVVGRGAADMKGGLAVMLELAEDLGRGAVRSPDLDVAVAIVGREELPFEESALRPLLERSEPLRRAALAIVLEPTANALEVGCLGNLNVRVTVRGAAAHSARPWLGDNAIHRAIEALGSIADLPVRDVVVDGLVFREVVSVTTIEGGTTLNVVPDLVTAHVNFRYAPSHTPEEAEARLRELLGHHTLELEVIGNAPPAPVTTSNPLVARLRAAGDLEPRPKQAWTPVAEFAMHGVDAVNLGPGDPRYAHVDDERVDAASLVRTYDVLRAFLEGRAAAEEPSA